MKRRTVSESVRQAMRTAGRAGARKRWNRLTKAERAEIMRNVRLAGIRKALQDKGIEES